MKPFRALMKRNLVSVACERMIMIADICAGLPIENADSLTQVLPAREKQIARFGNLVVGRAAYQ